MPARVLRLRAGRGAILGHQLPPLHRVADERTGNGIYRSSAPVEGSSHVSAVVAIRMMYQPNLKRHDAKTAAAP